MYDEIYHIGKSLREWQAEMKYEFSLGELYTMMREGTDFCRLSLEINGILEKD